MTDRTDWMEQLPAFSGAWLMQPYRIVQHRTLLGRGVVGQLRAPKARRRKWFVKRSKGKDR